jgi:hypothetical protein
MCGAGWRGERRGGLGQITAHSNPHSSFSLSFFPLCVLRGFDEKILHLAVQYTIIDQCTIVLKTPQFLHFLINSEVGSAIFLGGALSLECYLFFTTASASSLPFQICQCAKRYSAIAEAAAMRYPPPHTTDYQEIIE